MKRTALATLAGCMSWVVVGSLLILCLRMTWPAYEAAWPTRDYTLPMQVTRLTISCVASIASGALATLIDPHRGKAALFSGLALLLFSTPYHIMIWEHYPAWYHLFYLFSLVPFSVLGARLIKEK